MVNKMLDKICELWPSKNPPFATDIHDGLYCRRQYKECKYATVKTIGAIVRSKVIFCKKPEEYGKK